jgi:cytidine deaminase
MAKLDENTRHQLAQSALQAQKQSYSPYSHFAVGAALLTPEGDIITGCNVENASYGATICAERTAAVKAVSMGHREFQAVAVASPNGVFPCGICRQFLLEFTHNRDLTVITLNSAGEVLREVSLSTLLPGAFGPDELEDGQKTSA